MKHFQKTKFITNVNGNWQTKTYKALEATNLLENGIQNKQLPDDESLLNTEATDFFGGCFLTSFEAVDVEDNAPSLIAMPNPPFGL